MNRISEHESQQEMDLCKQILEFDVQPKRRRRNSTNDQKLRGWIDKYSDPNYFQQQSNVIRTERLLTKGRIV